MVALVATAVVVPIILANAIVDAPPATIAAPPESVVDSAPPSTEPAPTTSPPTITTATTTTTPAPTTTAPATSTTTTIPSAVPTRGGSVRLGLVGFTPVSLNPLTSESAVVAALNATTQGRAWALHPVSLTPTAELVVEVPSLANGGIVENADGTVTFQIDLRADAVWSDGVPVTGEDLRETARQLAGTEPYDLIDPASWLVGHKSVRFDLVTADLRWLELFEVVLPSHRVAGTNAFTDWDSEPWPVAGAFTLEEDDEGIRLVANPNFYGTDPVTFEPLPYLDEIAVTLYPTASDAQAALAAGEVDIVPLDFDYRFDPPPSAPQLATATATGGEYEHIAFQLGETRFDRNPRSLNGSAVYRNLVALLLDRDTVAGEIADVVALTSIAGASWPAASSSGWPDDALSPEQVRVAVDEIEAELGYDFDVDRAEVRLNTTNSLQRSLVAGVVTQALASGGLLVDVGLEDPGLFFRDFVISGQFDMAQWAWEITPGPLGAVDDLTARFTDPETTGSFNFYQWSAEFSPQAAEVNAVLAELGATVDLDEVSDSLRRVDELIAADMVVIPLYQSLVGTTYAVDFVGGVDMPVGGLPVTEDAATWFAPQTP